MRMNKLKNYDEKTLSKWICWACNFRNTKEEKNMLGNVFKVYRCSFLHCRIQPQVRHCIHRIKSEKVLIDNYKE